MSTEMNATETVQRARGQVWCGCGDGQGNCYSRRWLDYPTTGLATIHVVTEKCGVAHEPPWEPYPDPLADTPEGWWEFGQILEWAEAKSRVLLIMSMREAVRKVVMQVPPRQAFIESLAELVHHYTDEALAEAVGGQGK